MNKQSRHNRTQYFSHILQELFNHDGLPSIHMLEYLLIYLNTYGCLYFLYFFVFVSSDIIATLRLFEVMFAALVRVNMAISYLDF
jgi:hypothetical protein